MRISREREELARMKYGQLSGEISRKYADQSRRTQFMPRGGAQGKAADDAHIGRLTEMADAWIDVYLQAFTEDGVTPDANDLREMEERIDQMFAGRYGNEFYRPLASSTEAIRMIPFRAKHKLRIGVKEMQLASQRQQAELPATSASVHYTTNVENNYGGLQVGGQGNTQNINNQFNTKIQELLNLIDVAQELSPVQKLKAASDIRAIQELSRLETTPEVVEEARGRLEGVTSVISLSADLVSLGMPIIMIIRAFFGV